MVYYCTVMKKLISINKAAEILDVHPNTLKRWDKSGRLKSVRLGPRGDRKYVLEDLEAFILRARRGRKIYPHVGIVPAISVMVFNKKNQILIGRRTADFGKGKYCFVGGSLAFGESFEEGAKNEAKDKAGIKIKNPRVLCVTNNRKNISKVQQQSITIGLLAEYKSGKVIDGRAERIVDFKWYDVESIPKRMIEADRKIMKCYKEKKFYID